MTQMYQCPANGCDYEGVRNSVASHYSGKTDDAHQGGYEKAQTMLDDQAPIGQAEGGSVDEEPDDGGSDDGGDTGGSELQFPENPDADEDNDGCPECGRPLSPVPADVEFTTQDGRHGITEGTEQHCERCGILVEPDGEVVR